MDYLQHSSYKDTHGVWIVHLHVNGRMYWRLTPTAAKFRHHSIRVVSSIEPHALVRKKAWRTIFSALSGAGFPKDVPGQLELGRVDRLELHTDDGKDVFTVDHAVQRATEANCAEDALYPKALLQTDVETSMCCDVTRLQHSVYEKIPPVYNQQHRYWVQMQTFPSHTKLPRISVHSAMNALLWSRADRLLFPTSNAPYTKESCSEMITSLQDISEEAAKNEQGISLETWYVSAILRYINAQLYRNRARLEESPEFDPKILSIAGSLIWTFLSFALLTSPYGYLRRITAVDRTKIGDGVSTIRWHRFISSLCHEWNASNLLSTVLISATVSLLAAPGMDGVAVILAVLSVICAIFSICFGLYLLWMHQTLEETDGGQALHYFTRATALTGSPHLLALGLSLPLASTIYGMLLFLASIVAYAVDSRFPSVQQIIITVMRYASVASLGLLLALACILLSLFDRTVQQIVEHFHPPIPIVEAPQQEEGSLEVGPSGLSLPNPDHNMSIMRIPPSTHSVPSVPDSGVHMVAQGPNAHVHLVAPGPNADVPPVQPGPKGKIRLVSRGPNVHVHPVTPGPNAHIRTVTPGLNTEVHPVTGSLGNIGPDAPGPNVGVRTVQPGLIGGKLLVSSSHTRSQTPPMEPTRGLSSMPAGELWGNVHERT
ncbi:hypothetical protein PUNSTDRAFT_46680 [Punctularia strigosozonata HHB-11173 SS5]|uniref:uncharacterized protein n=1 Tax=Punctularia strigosozonata (strain HHB-11173) TaxID=741275 RepID=UPI0004417466|nr:uncharacterized protein PUNSTDRAFT_46680 [Punctularia strigosozonata HHB-11173 SS5]EIN05855.1 hypothetical protein PUNSTDRAFT_46680 [Punctularia strigosozonata HHB-11173 SS5]